MLNRNSSADITPATKPHFITLDGLRGVAALMVLCYHIFEAFATSHIDQRVNHGYLAVDFFFLLSGFVMAHAYDNKGASMSTWAFIKRRIIRLHPMVVMGALIGAIFFYTQGCSFWEVSKISILSLLFATTLNVFLIPVTPGAEIRGVGEMFPLNGPSWSLFFEYLGNLLYIFILRKLSTKALAMVVFIAAAGLVTYAIKGPDGDVAVGFSLTGIGFLGGSLRLLFSFSAGLLLARVFKPIKIKGAFWYCSIVLIILLGMPRIGDASTLWLNGIYDSICCLLLFPALVYLGASDVVSSKAMQQVNKFLGDLSYPLYTVHYPFIYLYFAWVKNNKLSFEDSFPGAAALFIGSIILALICLKFYDIPVRRYLTKKYLFNTNSKEG